MEIKNKIFFYLVLSLTVLLFLFMVKGENTVDYGKISLGEIPNDNPSVSEVVLDNQEIVLTDNPDYEEEVVSIVSSEDNDQLHRSKDISNVLDGLSEENQTQQLIELFVIDSPNLTIYKFESGFLFSINLTNVNSVNCSFNITNQSSMQYSQEFYGVGNMTVNKTVSLINGSYTWSIGCFDPENLSIGSQIETDVFTVSVDTSPKISFWADKYNLVIGENVNIGVNASLGDSSMMEVTVTYSNGEYSHNSGVGPSPVSNKAMFSRSFSSSGTYGLNLNITSNGNSYYRNITLVVTSNSSNNSNNNANNNSSQSGKDNEDPDVTLIFPDDEDNLNSNSVDFLFKAKDNVKLSNCTFNLYYYNTSQYIGSLVYKQVFTNPDNDKNISVILRDFDVGDYSWDVECLDNSSNNDIAERDFYFGTESDQNIVYVSEKTVSDYTSDLDEVEHLISLINEFLVSEEKYDKESREAVEFLDLLETSRFYKKRLLQIKSDLNDNLGYSRDSSGKEARLDSLRKEIEEIKSKVIYKVSVDKSETYAKNSLSSELHDIIKSYLDSQNTFMSEREINNLVEEVSDSQNDLNVETHIKWVNFEYLDGNTAQKSMVYKKISGADSFEGIIEVIPKSVANDLSDVEFSNEFVTVKNDPVVFFESETLDGKIVYLVDSKVDFEELRKIDSIGFNMPSSGSLGKNSITGYSILLFPKDKGFWFYFSWVLFAIIISVIIYRSIVFRKIKNIKRDPNYNLIKESLKKAKNALDDKNLPLAKETYAELKRLYSESKDEIKSFFYKDLAALGAIIDRKEISSLIRECIDALNKKRNADAALIYSKIRPIYKRLPEDLRAKVYEKIMPFIVN